jgi:hypothetical protein
MCSVLVLLTVLRVLEDRDLHLAGTVRNHDVVVEVGDGASIEAHVADANGNDATGDVELELGQMNLDVVHRKDFLVGEFSFEPNMAFGSDDEVMNEFLSHERFGYCPALCKTIFPLDGVDHAVDRTERTMARFELFAHVVVLLVASASLEAEELFGGKFVFDRHSHGHFLQVNVEQKKTRPLLIAFLIMPQFNGDFKSSSQALLLLVQSRHFVFHQL